MLRLAAAGDHRRCWPLFCFSLARVCTAACATRRLDAHFGLLSAPGRRYRAQTPLGTARQSCSVVFLPLPATGVLGQRCRPCLASLVVGGGRTCPAATAGHVHRAGVHAAHRSQVCAFLLVHAIVAGAMSFDLDESQQEAWELYLEKKNVCLFGRAGCGKSTLILRAIAHAQRTHGTNRVVVLAWTNFAANLVGGKTLHKFLRVGIADVPKDVILEKVRCNAFARESVKAAKVIFIDELPQFPARWFAVLEFVVRQLALDSHQGRPWGGIQVVGTFRREAVYSSCVGEALLDRWYEDCP